jgi:hypothetical protein
MSCRLLLFSLVKVRHDFPFLAYSPPNRRVSVYEKQHPSFNCSGALPPEAAPAMPFTAFANRCRLIFDHAGCARPTWGVLLCEREPTAAIFPAFAFPHPWWARIGGNEICFCLTADHTEDTIMDGQNFCHGVSLYSSVRPIIVLCLREDGHAPCLPRGLAAKSPHCEATGKPHATCWRLTSPGTPAILRGVGRSPGDCVALEAGPR